MKFKNYLLIGVLTLVVIGSVFFNNSPTKALDEKTQFLDFGKSISNDFKQQKNKLDNPTALDKNQLNTLKRYYETFYPTFTKQQINDSALNVLIEETSIIAAAKEKNLLPSSEDINKRVEKERNNFYNATGEQNEKIKEMVKNLIKGLGISEDEYWSTYLPNGYVYTLSAEKLYNYETKDVDGKEAKEQKWKDSKNIFINDFERNNKNDIEKFKSQN